jgi:hypothetical protein
VGIRPLLSRSSSRIGPRTIRFPLGDRLDFVPAPWSKRRVVEIALIVRNVLDFVPRTKKKCVYQMYSLNIRQKRSFSPERVRKKFEFY